VPVMRLGVAAALIEGTLVQGDVGVADGRIAGVGLPGAGTGLAVPGLVDLQVNGSAGVDFLAADVDDYALAGRALLETGVVAYQPTLISAEEAELVHALTVAGRARAEGGRRARILGVHLEGPFLSPRYRGVHSLAALRAPDRGLMLRLLDAGPVTSVTLAPELPASLDLVDLLVARGILVACGHSDATADQAHAAFDRGARTVTHIFNAMRPFHHRNPGIVGAALSRDDVAIQMICDGVHLAPETLGMTRRAARGRLCLVTDSVPAAGLGDGSYHIGTQKIEVRLGVARGADGQLAGGTVALMAAVRNLWRLGATIEEAVGTVTATPARLLGRPDLGVLGIGRSADVVVLDDDLRITRVLLAGRDEL